jgi:two-component system nitrogen regulation response regulator GlnG
MDGLRILVVDDEPQVARGLARNLTRAGARATVASSVAQALQQLERGAAWDIVLVDQMLPDGDGIDVLDWIERRQAKPAVVVISANPLSAQHTLLLQACGAVLLPKPFDADDLARALSEALAARAATRAASTNDAIDGAQRADTSDALP